MGRESNGLGRGGNDLRRLPKGNHLRPGSLKIRAKNGIPSGFSCHMGPPPGGKGTVSCVLG